MEFTPWVYQSNRGRGQTRHKYEQRRFQDRFRSNNTYRGRPRYVKIIEVGQDMVLIIGVVMEIIWEVIRDIGDRIIIIEWGNFRNQNYDGSKNKSY